MVVELIIVGIISVFSGLIIYKNIKNKGNCNCDKCSKDCLSRHK